MSNLEQKASIYKESTAKPYILKLRNKTEEDQVEHNVKLMAFNAGQTMKLIDQRLNVYIETMTHTLENIQLEQSHHNTFITNAVDNIQKNSTQYKSSLENINIKLDNLTKKLDNLAKKTDDIGQILDQFDFEVE